jgi:hypothetical protein
MPLRTWLRSLRNNSTSPARRPRPLAVERLEAREVPSAVAPASGLVSWWTADNTAADLKGLNNATLFNGTTYAAGMVGQAFNFDGVDDRTNMADSASLKLTNSLTIEGWIRADTGMGGVILMRADDRGGLDPYNFSLDSSGALQFAVTPSTNQGVSVRAPIPLGQFIHVAGTLDDTTGAMKLYVNGKVVAQTVTSIRPFGDLDPASNPAVGIGNHGGYPNTPHNFPFDGLIDELAIYNRALTGAEIRGIHAAGAAGKVKAASHIAADFPTATEGAGSVTFTLTRVGSTSDQVVVNWATADRDATAGSDYVVAAGQVVFQPGETVKTVTVNLVNDATPEAAETFWLTLSTPTSGWAAGSGLATVTDDDVGVSIGDATGIEGAAGYGSRGALVDLSANGGLIRSTGLAWGPDGSLYVGSIDTDQVLRYDGATGAFLGVFIDSEATDSPALQGLHFRPDGKLYVLSRDRAEVRRFDAITGAFLDVFIPSGSGGLTAARGMTFGPDGTCYISSGDSDQVLRYDGTTGAFLGVFVAAGSGGLDNPRGLAFGPDGHLYVAAALTNAILRYDGATGAFLGTFATGGGLINPGELLFQGGDLLVSSPGTNQVLRYNAATGAFIDVAVAAGLDGLDRPLGLLFDPNGHLLVGGYAAINRYAPGATVVFTVRLSTPSSTSVTVTYTTVNGTATAGSDYTAVSGTITFAPGQTTRTIFVPILNNTVAENAEAFTLVLSDPVGATVTDGTGVAAVTDDDATKFFVVNDGSPDQTYRYGAPGNGQTTSSHDSGNTAPRGAAGTAAGDKVWVVDANKKVYVYSAAGGLLGSWTAGSLTGNAVVEGITVWGNDVWLVDARQDRVYRYAGAATRLTGSQNATSNFALNSGNRDPKDLVTDGTSIWVVNDTTTDNVFKYTLNGSLLGSWTMTGGGGSPTGITLDPTGASQDLWVVDNATDRVYRYAGGRSLTSGTAAAADSFALAAGNTNPQGIAEPPVPAGTGESRPTVSHTATTVFWPTTNTVDSRLDPAAGSVTRRSGRNETDGGDPADVFPLEPTSAADYAWAEPFGESGGELGWAVALDPSGLVRLAGMSGVEPHPLDAFHRPEPSVSHPRFPVKVRQN